MIKLLNGRGQLGDALAERVEGLRTALGEDIYIYHTWNIDDKSEQAQQRCFEDLMAFVSRNSKEKIVFVSTTSNRKAIMYTISNLQKHTFFLTVLIH